MIDDAITALRNGKFILLYDFDDREGETDFAIRSDMVTPRHILQMRKDGGGLICTAVDPVAAARLGLPFASEVLQGTGSQNSRVTSRITGKTTHRSHCGSITKTRLPVSRTGTGRLRSLQLPSR